MLCIPKDLFMKTRSLLSFLLVLPFLFACSEKAPAAAAPVDYGYPWLGAGTKEEPFLISSVADLDRLKSSVNVSKETYKNTYFLQTCDLDFKDTVWDAIGSPYEGTSFRGIYNGGAHVITNLHSPLDHDYCYGLFGQLGGVVLNLGLASGKLYGNATGGFASHSTGDSGGLIMNCFSNLDIDANRAGGLVDNFLGGRIANCFSLGSVNGPVSGSITSITATLCQNVAYVGNPVNGNYQGALANCISTTKETLKEAVEHVNASIVLLPGDKNLSLDIGDLARFKLNEDGTLGFGDFFKTTRPSENEKNRGLYTALITTGILMIVAPLIVFLFVPRKKKLFTK